MAFSKLYSPTAYQLQVIHTLCRCGAENTSSELFLVATLVGPFSGPITRLTPVVTDAPLRSDLSRTVLIIRRKRTAVCHECFTTRTVAPPEHLRVIHYPDLAKLAAAKTIVKEKAQLRSRERDKLLGIERKDAAIIRSPLKNAPIIELDEIVL